MVSWTQLNSGICVNNELYSNSDEILAYFIAYFSKYEHIYAQSSYIFFHLNEFPPQKAIFHIGNSIRLSVDIFYTLNHHIILFPHKMTFPFRSNHISHAWKRIYLEIPFGEPHWICIAFYNLQFTFYDVEFGGLQNLQCWKYK